MDIKEQKIEKLTDYLSDHLLGERIPVNITDENGKVIIGHHRKITKSVLKKLATHLVR